MNELTNHVLMAQSKNEAKYVCVIHVFPLVWDVVELEMPGKKKTKQKNNNRKSSRLDSRDENPEVQMKIISWLSVWMR